MKFTFFAVVACAVAQGSAFLLSTRRTPAGRPASRLMAAQKGGESALGDWKALLDGINSDSQRDGVVKAMLSKVQGWECSGPEGKKMKLFARGNEEAVVVFVAGPMEGELGYRPLFYWMKEDNVINGNDMPYISNPNEKIAADRILSDINWKLFLLNLNVEELNNSEFGYPTTQEEKDASDALRDLWTERAMVDDWDVFGDPNSLGPVEKKLDLYSIWKANPKANPQELARAYIQKIRKAEQESYFKKTQEIKVKTQKAADKMGFDANEVSDPTKVVEKVWQLRADELAKEYERKVADAVNKGAEAMETFGGELQRAISNAKLVMNPIPGTTKIDVVPETEEMKEYSKGVQKGYDYLLLKLGVDAFNMEDKEYVNGVPRKSTVKK
uniref:Uncharacterized protein n=1 Tax=Chromera velia CCMP2878 TaxID=1169474 RepID=A0A0G4I2R5_9ALVE|mmetsp:Transcript_46221/g.91149  ORF Transcript_46221/g.91149 Transcript_46221/m.91149 type:complete len:385 (+) Transcript_46221:90-1244(+)|eukprot:Cvel_10445.t1-p1 / transcript=Cvel_10445.t1 / gene=Cvel_10445 / organism=Chromera_velia_CCMP2878 / gene_product=hypothetical protein / transcript_product=hypothetical protein / location=Cvel_scaffold629:20430-26499(+) / protein_length=384 / sequence_SO=supercontig / SO=protein_coding / is_pseudo=false